MMPQPLKKHLPLLLCSLLLALPAPSKAATGRLFNSIERASENINPFHKWTGQLERSKQHNLTLAAACKGNTPCIKNDWQEMLDGLKTAPRLEQIRAVNSYMNHAPYIQDMLNWGMEDYWTTLLEFFTSNGDCEDYAIAKYYSLRELGFDEDALRIVILNDQNLGVMHAVLAVYEGGKIYILDNQSPEVLEDKSIHHYQPIYSINKNAWWRHVPAPANRAKL